MIKADDGTVYLEKGEAVPCACECGEVYQPALESEWSGCPACGRENVHHHHTVKTWRLVEGQWSHD